jgi:hypothetical protein
MQCAGRALTIESRGTLIVPINLPLSQALEPTVMVSNSDAVTSLFGDLPEFADAHVKTFSYLAGGTISMQLPYIDTITDNRADISLSFHGARNMELGGIEYENLLDALEITGDGPLLDTLHPCAGIGGSFECTSASVTEVVSNNRSSGRRPGAT